MKSIAETLGARGEAWLGAPGIAEEQLQELVRKFPELPAEYLELLRVNNGGEGELNLPPRWFQLYDAQTVMEIASMEITELHPGFIFFGSNGGLETIAFNIRGTAPWPVVMLDTVAGPDSAVQIAQSVGEFIQAIGVAFHDAAQQ